MNSSSANFVFHYPILTKHNTVPAFKQVLIVTFHMQIMVKLTCALLWPFAFVLSSTMLAATDPILFMRKGSGRTFINWFPNGNSTEKWNCKDKVKLMKSSLRPTGTSQPAGRN